jgi:hypothetical protein
MSDPHVNDVVNVAAAAQTAAAVEAPAPPKPSSSILIVDLGEKKRKQIKQLRQGRGKLFDEVNELLKDLRSTSTIPESAQPVILIVKESKDGKSLFSWLD